MSTMNIKNYLILPILWLNICVTVFGQNVPLLVWSSGDLTHCTSEMHLSLTPEQSVFTIFNKDYMNCLKVNPPQNILVFLIDGFSIEDITLYGNDDQGSFENIHQFIQTYGFSVPSVESANLLDDIKIITSDYFRSAFSVKELEEPVNPKDFKEMDQFITKEVEKLDGSYLAILSSNKPKGFTYQLEYNTGRHLLETNTGSNDTKPTTPTKPTNPFCLIGKCVQMCFSEITFKKDGISKSINPTDSDFTQENCTAINQTTTKPVYISVSKSFTVVNQSIGFSMTFQKKLWTGSGITWWALSAINLNNNSENVVLSNRTFYPDISAPVNWSYGCASPNAFTDKTKTTELIFKDLQVQAFYSATNGNFLQKLDCSGWFTGPIWAGLLVSLLLIIMLSYAYGMISSITTMDKFDNPKGKTISVPQES